MPSSELFFLISILLQKLFLLYDVLPIQPFISPVAGGLTGESWKLGFSFSGDIYRNVD